MGKAYPVELAWRVVAKIRWFGQTPAEVCDPETGLGISAHYVRDVLDRFDEWPHDLETHQGVGANHVDRRTLTAAEDMKIVMQLVASPRVTLKDQRAQFILETGVLISYSSFCQAVRRLGYTRKKVRTSGGNSGTHLCAVPCACGLGSFAPVGRFGPSPTNAIWTTRMHG